MIFHDQDTMVAMKGTTARISRIFLYLIHIDFAHAPTQDTLADGNRQLSRLKMGFLRMPDFL